MVYLNVLKLVIINFFCPQILRLSSVLFFFENIILFKIFKVDGQSYFFLDKSLGKVFECFFLEFDLQDLKFV